MFKANFYINLDHVDVITYNLRLHPSNLASQQGHLEADTSRKHLRIKVTPDFHLTYSKKWGKSGVGIKMIKSEKFPFFSIKSYVVNVY